MNPGGGGCGDPRSRHCTPAWVTRAKLRLKKKKKKNNIKIDSHYTMIKGLIQQEDITIINIYAPNTGAPRYLKEILLELKRETDPNTIRAEEFIASLSALGRSCRQNINKETLDLIWTMKQMDVMDIHRTFHPVAAECIFFSSADGSFSRLDHMLGHKTSL